MLSLLLKKDTIAVDSVTINATNPALDNDNRGKTYTYPFKLKWTPQLLNQLKHARRFDAKVAIQNLKATLTHNNVQIAKGILKTNEGFQSSYEHISIHIKDDSNAIVEKLQDVKLADLCPKLVINQAIEGKYKLTVPAVTTVGTTYFINLNSKNYSHTAASTQSIEVLTAIKNAINADYPGVATTINNSPGLELHITTSDNFNPRIEEFTGGFTFIYAKNYADSVHENYHVFLKNSLVNPRTDVSFNFCYNDGFYEGKNKDFFFQWFNYASFESNDWNVRKNTPSVTEHFERSFIPFYRLSYIFSRILERLQLSGVVRCSGNPVWWSDIEKILIDNNFALDNVRKDWFWESGQTVEKYLNCHVKEIDPANHLPDMTAHKFLNDFSDFFNLSFKIVKNDLVFSPKNAIFSQKTQVWDTMLKGYANDYKDNLGYTLAYQKSEYELHTDTAQLQPRTIGEGDTKITLPASTLYNDSSFEFCYSKRLGGTAAYGIGKKPFGLRFFFTKPTPQYLGCSHTLGHLSLQIEGEKGLYNILWKGSAELRAGGYPLSIERMVTPSYLSKLMTFEKSKIQLMSDNGNVRAFVQKVSGKIDTNNQLIRAKIELIVA
jgi:hypothetical protein